MPPLRVRSRWTYRVALVLPLVVLAYLLGSGRAAAYWRLLASGATPTSDAFRGAIGTAVLWIAAALPLTILAWDLGRQHVRARRRNYELLVGFRDVVRYAIGRAPASAVEEYAQVPRDDPRVALAIGAGVALFVPGFFLSAASPLRSPLGAVLVIGAGVLMGSLVYCGWRAPVYLVDEPARWSPLRAWRITNPDRYTPGGRPFARWLRIGPWVLAAWWLGFGSVVMSRWATGHGP